MKRLVFAAALAAALFVIVLRIGGPGPALSTAAAQTGVAAAPVMPAGTRPSGFYDGDAGPEPSERAGREIWYKATAGNSRFHTYVFQQRVGVLIDWHRVLNAERPRPLPRWGIINDPDCCVPGSDGCPAKSLDETYGFEMVPRRRGRCSSSSASRDTATPRATSRTRRSMGRRAPQGEGPAPDRVRPGVRHLHRRVGFRSFPIRASTATAGDSTTPRSSTATTGGSPTTAQLDSADRRARRRLHRARRFLIGTSLPGSCPRRVRSGASAEGPANPKWVNIKGGIGNQYTRISGSADLGHVRHDAGGADVRARPSRHVRYLGDPHRPGEQPGTINAIIHTRQRPTVLERTGQQVAQGRALHARHAVLVRAGARRQVLETNTQKSETVHHILKGGEDSIGALEAIQRVYFNIGRAAKAAGSTTSPTCARSIRSRATSARRRSTSASAAATAELPRHRGPRSATSSRSCRRRKPTPPICHQARAASAARSTSTPTSFATSTTVRRRRGGSRPAGIRAKLRTLSFEHRGGAGRPVRRARLPQGRTRRACAKTSSATTRPRR